MATKSLKEIEVKQKNSFKFSDHDFRNKKEWPIEKIFEYAFFHCSEEERHQLEDIVKERGSFTLWKRYINNIVLNGAKAIEPSPEEEIEFPLKEFLVRMFLKGNGFDDDKITLEFTPNELDALIRTYRFFHIEIGMNYKKSNDSNRSRKKHDEPTRKEYLISLKKKMLHFLMQEPHSLKKTPALKIIKHLL